MIEYTSLFRELRHSNLLINHITIYYLHDESVLTTIDLRTSLQEERYCQGCQVVKSLENSLQDNSSTDSLYPPEQWGMEWDTEEENLVPTEHQYLLNDLYWCGDYDNVLRSEYER